MSEITIIVYAVRDGKIIGDDKAAKIRGEFPDQGLIEGARSIAIENTKAGGTSYIYAHHKNPEPELHLNAINRKYPLA